MVAAGRANGMPSESSIELLCASPMPSRTRPPAISLSVSACAASMSGWRNQIGMTAVPSSIVLGRARDDGERGQGVRNRELCGPVRAEAVGLGGRRLGGELRRRASERDE